MSTTSPAPAFTSRVPGPDAEAIYSAAQWWFDRCFNADGSVFTDQPLWTVDNLTALHDAFVGNPFEDMRSFTDKLKVQLSEAAPQVKQLAAEMLWLMMLFPANLRAETKIGLVRSVWSWSGEELADTRTPLAPLRARGIGSAGQAYNQYRWLELTYFIRLTREWKTGQRDRWSPSSTSTLSDAFSPVPDNENRQLRHILLHLIYPDAFEPVTTTKQKLEIRSAFSSHLTPPGWLPKGPRRLTIIDQDLQTIRKALQAAAPNRRIDFYEPELYARWSDPRSEPPRSFDSKFSAHAEDVIVKAAAFAHALESRGEAGDTALLAAALSQAGSGSDPGSGGVLIRAIEASDPSYGPLSDSVHHNRVQSVILGADLTANSRLGNLYNRDVLTDGTRRPVLDALVANASAIAVQASGGSEIHGRHLHAALIRPDGPRRVLAALRRLGVDVPALRREFCEFIRESVPDDDLGAWRKVLIDGDTLAVRPNPGYSADDLHGDDQLGIADEAKAFASVIASSSVQPPLSIGLFGDWGSGKSFFMRRMEKCIDDLSARARAARENGRESAYCGAVVQIWFNAWHYIDANLWASLASHIFESLATADLGPTDDPEAARRELFGSLEASRALLAEADHRKQSALAAEHAAESRVRALHEAESTLHERMNAAADEAKALYKVGRDHPAVADLISRAADKLEMPADELLGRSLKEHAESIRGAWGSISMGFHIMKAKPRRWVTAVGIVVVAGVLAVVAQAVLTRWGWDRVGAIAASVGAWLTAVAAAARPWVERARKAADMLKQADAEMEKQAATRREVLERKQDRLAEEVTRLKVATAEAEQQRAEAERRVADVQREIEEIRAGRRLERFIQERSAADDYRRHLGIVAVIRRDFERLSGLLTEASAAHDGRPSVERIILYVDDLDRCPEERVVEVLQAIHLLLAFPLFVVVVGVDSRWLLRSVRRHYAGLLDARRPNGRGRSLARSTSTADGDADADAWGSTPQSYLEKIFQIPYALRPMDTTGFGRLLESLLPVRPERRPEATTTATAEVPETPGDTASSPRVDDGRSMDDENPSNLMQDREPVETDFLDDEDDAEPADPEMLPPGLELDAEEVRFLGQLLPLIGSPRMAKRLANLYRFLRAGLTAEELDRFRGRGDVPGEHRIAALLLATLTGFPVEGPRLLRALAAGDAPAESTVGYYVEKLADEQARPRTEKAAAGWKRVAAAFHRLDVDVLEGFTVSAAAPWAPRVARFAFQVPAGGA